MEHCKIDLIEAKKKMKNFTDYQASLIIKQILLAINYLHSNNIIHRDLKPGFNENQ